jgi:hypothetical protein
VASGQREHVQRLHLTGDEARSGCRHGDGAVPGAGAPPMLKAPR